MELYKELPLRTFASSEAWGNWLDVHRTDPQGIWLKFAKKGSGAVTLTYEEARNTAIAYGWIDGLLNKFDETYYLIRFTQRRPASGWSKVNREVAERLIAEGLMQPEGLLHVQSAKQDGRWERAYDSQSAMQVPEDFERALDRSPGAREHFESLKKSNRYAFLYRIQTAKTPALRAAKIERFIGMLEAGESFHPLV